MPIGCFPFLSRFRNRNANQQQGADATETATGDAPPPYSVDPPTTQEQEDRPNDRQNKFDPSRMTKSVINNLHNDLLQIDTLSLTDQWLEIGNNHNGKYTINNLVLKNSKLEAGNLHNTTLNISTLRMDYGSIEARNNITSIMMNAGSIDLRGIHNATIRIGVLKIGNVTIKGNNMQNSQLLIDRLIPNESFQSTSVQLRTLQNVRVDLRLIDISAGVNGARFMELIMMRASYT